MLRINTSHSPVYIATYKGKEYHIPARFLLGVLRIAHDEKITRDLTCPEVIALNEVVSLESRDI